MTLSKYTSVFALALLAACSAAAQGNPGNIAALESQTPKPGMTQQYEQGRKQKADWHKQQKDPLPLFVFETISGDATGTYIVGRLGQHWGDFDKPAVPEAADNDEYNKVIGAYVQSVTDRYYEYLPKLSNPDNSSSLPSKYTEIRTMRVSRGKLASFRAAVARVTEAAQKTKWPVHFEFYELVNGGMEGTFVLALPHANWADFEDNPNVKPFREMVKDAFGAAEADAIIDRVESPIESEYTDIVKFRQDLSYIPAKQ